MLLWVDIGYVVFGIEVKAEKVIRVAPVAGWMVGKDLVEVVNWLKRKRAVIKEIKINVS